MTIAFCACVYIQQDHHFIFLHDKISMKMTAKEEDQKGIILQ